MGFISKHVENPPVFRVPYKYVFLLLVGASLKNKANIFQTPKGGGGEGDS